jgi:hypothetical protein
LSSKNFAKKFRKKFFRTEITATDALVAAFFFGVTRLTLKLFPSLLLRLNLNKTSGLVAIVPVFFYTLIVGLGVAAVGGMLLDRVSLAKLFSFYAGRGSFRMDAI